MDRLIIDGLEYLLTSSFSTDLSKEEKAYISSFRLNMISRETKKLLKPQRKEQAERRERRKRKRGSREDKEQRQAGVLSFDERIKQGYHLLCDGGTSSNTPPYGEAYGSFMLFHDGKIMRHEKLKFGRGSSNSAEVDTIRCALLMVANEDVLRPFILHVYSDSNNALGHVRRHMMKPSVPVKTTAGVSPIFYNAVVNLKKALGRIQCHITANKVPREVPKRYLRH